MHLQVVYLAKKITHTKIKSQHLFLVYLSSIGPQNALFISIPNSTAHVFQKIGCIFMCSMYFTHILKSQFKMDSQCWKEKQAGRNGTSEVLICLKAHEFSP